MLILIAVSVNSSAQNNHFGEGTVNWEIRKPFVTPAAAEKYAGSDLVILSDYTEFFFYSASNEKLTRNIKYKINTQKGLDQLKHFKTPESFDFAFDADLFKQSRRSKIKIPYIKEYSVKLFAARKFSHGRWSNVSVKDTYEQIRWITSTGEFSNEDLLVLQLGTLAVGDVLEIYYEATFNSHYGNNIFYFNGPWPKLSCEYNFVYRTNKTFTDKSYILPVNVDSMQVSASRVNYGDYELVTTKIHLNDLKANNFPANSFESGKMPHICADFSFYRATVNFNNDQFSFANKINPKNFDWVISLDTTVADQTTIYDKQFAAIRKFCNSLPPLGRDSQNVVFLRALCDTFNNYRFISPNHLFYNESNLYELYSGDHLLKRRLAGHSMWKLYTDILRTNKLFFYMVNIQDKRFGEHQLKQRAHFGYEHHLIALPYNNSYVYFMPRFGGIKYHLNELPFYYENALAALTPMNFQPGTENKETKLFKIIKTHHGTFNENTRTENALAKIRLDSLLIHLTIKESLSGQYSTLLRHLYLNECIDSTVAPHYFKKCTDKPNAVSQKVKLSSKITEYPFRYNFNCSENIKLKDSSHLELKNWFSFNLDKKISPQSPNQDYYFEFDLSDAYNFSLDFNKAVTLKNADNFSKKISNTYFELESGITKNSANNYLVKVSVAIKRTSIPLADMNLLMELVEELER
ncbi:MAG: hypothetical protein IT236_05925 [Bacteroidia bacterium]|nr:hypothetical protein [Bacteroidia bacterium]